MKLHITFASAVLVGGLVAQSPCTPRVDVEAANSIALNLGVQYLNGSFYVSGTADTTLGPWSVFEVDPNTGTMTNSFAQPGISAGFGLRDGATDGTNLFFGSENGIVGFDVMGNDIATIDTANNPAAPFTTITGPALVALGTYRALAYDPAGNGGDGSFFCGNFGSDILELDLAGNVLNTLTNGGQWSAYGLAYDSTNDTLWVNDAGDDVTLIEIDANTGVATGRSTITVFGAPGGLSFGVDGNQLIALTQSTPDVVETLEVPGTLQLLTGVNGGPLSRLNKFLRVNDTSVELSIDGTSPAGIVFTSLSTTPDSLVCPDVLPPFGTVLRNWSLVAPFTNPSNLVDLVIPLAPGQTVSYPNSVVTGNLPDGPMRLQGAYIDSTVAGPLQIRATNDVLVDLDSTPLVGIVASADGANSFNSDTTSGFFQVVNNSTDPNKAIVEMTFDFSANLPGVVFDSDQTGMADAFWNGNSTSGAGCNGTYRNGSDVTAGLDYAAAQINLANPACQANPSENSGVEGTNGSGPSFSTLTWRFAGGQFYNGVVFEFDCDTDGTGTDGAAHAGMIVTVTLLDGSVISAPLTVAGAQRAEAQL